MMDEAAEIADKPDPQAFYTGVCEAVRQEVLKHPLNNDLDILWALSFMIGTIVGHGHPAFHQVIRARVFHCIDNALFSAVLLNSPPAGSA